MSQRLPEKGLWHVADRHRAEGTPFDLIKLDLRGRRTGAVTGTVRARNLETRLGRIRVTGPDSFVAVYDIRGHRGAIEGTVRPDGSLRLELSGTVTSTLVARAADPASADMPMLGFASAVAALCRSAACRKQRPRDLGQAAAA